MWVEAATSAHGLDAAPFLRDRPASLRTTSDNRPKFENSGNLASTQPSIQTMIPASRSKTLSGGVWCRSLMILSAMLTCRLGTTAFSSKLGFVARNRRLIPLSSTIEASTETSTCPLPFETLPYRGAAVRLDQNLDFHGLGGVPVCNDEFLEQLKTSLEFWKQNDYTSAWLHIPTSRAALIESLNNEKYGNEDLAFDLHHVNATENTIVLKKWLRPGDEDKIPPFATHQVGCAGFVLSEDNELLLVKEWTGSASNRTPTKQWKLPGGMLDAGETFGQAACREVFEETGITCEFESVLAFWHRHGLMFGKSDFYYVCLLKPTSKEINLDPVEVSDCTWMPIQEFLETQNHPLIHHVLENVYHLDRDQPHILDGQQTRLEPVIEMLEGHVQFGPDRPAFLTYTGRKERGEDIE